MNPKLNIVAWMGLWDPFNGLLWLKKRVCVRQLGTGLGDCCRSSGRKRMCVYSLLH